jgi:predicted amidophosphoribosyltransferase
VENEIESYPSWQYGNALNALRAWRDDPDDETEICCYCGSELVVDAILCPDCGQPATKLTLEDWREQ